MKPKVKLQITTLFLVLLLPENAILWRRRRRRRAPAPVNCQVGSWTSWGSCSYLCGDSGTQTRTRAITVAAAHGGTCSYHLSESQACNRGNCQNGGTPHSTGCSCRAGYTGTCCSQDINECLNNPCDHTCTNTFGSYTCQCNSCYTKLGTRCDLRQCRISGSCYSYDTVNPNNQCQDCQSTNKMAWTNNDTLSCSDGVACTRNDSCSSGTCAGTPYTCLSCEECDNDTCRVKEGFCAIVEGGTKTCFNHGDLRPGYPCQDCQSTNKMAWTNNDTLSCSDGVACTRNDSCSSGTCAGTPYTCLSCEECNNDTCRVKEGFCAIGEGGSKTCFNHGDLRPGYPCQVCQSTNKMAWTNNDTLSCNDGVACTRNDTCSNGSCAGIPYTCLSCEECNNDTCLVKEGFCAIMEGGTNTCFSHGDLRPGYPCQDCRSTNKMAWTNNDTLSCSDGVACTRNDTCSSGTCAGTPYTCLSCEECNNDTCRVKEGFCAIVEGGTKTCFSHGDLRPGYPCQWCDPSISTSTWSNREGVACNDGDQCTRGDTCQSGRCTTTPFTCNSLCQYCNGSGCSLKTGFGFTNVCTCKIGGHDYNNQTVNPSNQCEWCDLYDATARANGAWSNRSAVPCDDQNRCTKQDTCNSGRCEGQGYSCQSSFPSTSCIKTSECVGDGTCREIIRASGTICRPAIDICDQPERCDGNLETCPGAEHDSINITTGSAQFTDQSFLSVISYHNLTNKLYVRLTGFSASCGQLNFQWFLLSSSSACITSSTVKGAFPNSNTRQTLTGLPLQDNSNYKVSIQAVDMRNNTAQHVCSGVININ
ncbi:prestalk protein-like [Montipora foliosa]|uniref:prestalk protein-like n=1 Tax=Montipora foliosa TaxID=591990 RepID=UPI0035F176F0